MKEKGPALAIIFGKSKPKMGKGEMEPDDDSEKSEDYSEVPPDFEDEAIKAFPELEDDEDRVMAFWKAVRACMEA